jgi:hypothetical protein
MGTNRSTTMAVTNLSLAAIAAAGIVGSARADESGLLTLFVLVFVVVVLTSVVRLAVRPAERTLRVRADLVSWLERMSAVTGESPAAIAARGLSAYRAQLSGHDDG